jgi:hypothetical protein
MSVIDRVKEHFESQGVKTINVAEWGEEGQPLVIYCSPFSLAEKRNLFKGAKGRRSRSFSRCDYAKSKR